MKPYSVLSVITLVIAFFLSNVTQGQTFGTSASAVWLEDCNQSNFFNTSGSGPGLIGPAANAFDNSSLGIHTQNSGTLILRGGEVRSFKTVGLANVCSAHLYYRIYLQSGAPGTFTSMDLPLLDDCDVPTLQFPSGGACAAGDQKWSRVIADGTTVPYAPVNLTSLAPGNYVLEVYYDLTGSSASTTLCNETVVENNGGANYKAYFTIQNPILNSTNPTTCGGTEGYITISGLKPGATYTLNYTDKGVDIGPVNFIANGAGQIIIGGLSQGTYSNFSMEINGCTTQLNTGVILSNPVFTPTFSNFPPFCAGTTPPVLPATSNNGISGTWSPAIVSNTASGSYTFTPTGGQCGFPVTRNITVIQRTTPTFAFGTSLTICTGGIVPILPNTSSNGIPGTWSPAVVNNTNGGTYTFTPNAGQCANPATFTVTVNPYVTPTFGFGTSLTICAGGSVPALPGTSSNGLTGTWSPATVDNQNSGTYTFTPNAGQCGNTTSFTVTVNPNVTPTFPFGNSLTICTGSAVPLLPTTSNNGITGTWNPASINNLNSGSYTFTPSAGLCALPFTLNVTVNPNITPTFAFGTSLTICAGGIVPALTITSSNGITGTWNPVTVDNQNSGTYTFTPDAGQCATTATYTVTVNPNITPSFSFGTTLTMCAGNPAPSLPTASTNGITGSWSPAAVDNQNSGTYTFTPSAGQCATTTSFTVTVNPMVTPVFSFGTSLSICTGGSVPVLPNTSDNFITGNWSPSVVDNQNSGTYIFTPVAGSCAPQITFTVTVGPILTPSFSFGTSLTICAGGTVPALTGTSTNGITGTWSPATVDDQNSATYTFTPTAGQCAAVVTYTVTVNPNLTPSFSFGSSLTLCAGSAAPALPTTSTNSISGAWSPSSIDNQNSGTYTFTPNAGQCAVPTSLSVTVNPNVLPGFAFGTSLTICNGGSVPSLPNTSSNGITGTWNPSAVSNTASGTYTFTPTAGLCATTTTFTVTVNSNITPTFSFGTSQSICDGATAPILPTTSNNGITGTWSPSTVDNTASATYTFTPDAGQCALTATFTVTVNPNVTPTFGFGITQTICAGGSVTSLPATSSNGITGTWSPSTVDNQNSATYTFTPAAGQCAVTTAYTLTVTPNVTPVFSFGTSLTICSGGIVPALPAASTNGINGTWNPSLVDNTNSGTYTFTPAAGICALPVTFTVTVNPNITPTFSFGTSLNMCDGGAVPTLSNTSTNGITGTWSPAAVDNTNSGTYTFTPDAGQCAVTTTFTVTVNPIVTPSFAFGTSLSICAGSAVPVLATTSSNGITGSWSPATADNQNSGTYTFTPSAGQCATTATYTVTVTPNTVPTFSFGTSLSICTGGSVPALYTTSDNGITGTWLPAVVDNLASGVYTFTPNVPPGQCIISTTFTVSVNPIVTPSFSFGTAMNLCTSTTAPLLPATSLNGISGTWTPAVISNVNSGTYTFTPNAGQCVTGPVNFTVTIIPLATGNVRSDTTVYDGALIPSYIFTGTPSGVTFSWTNSNPAIGLPASGTGNTPPFTAINLGNSAISATITVTPSVNGCAGSSWVYIINILPLDKDIFVPNVFSPNADGKNDFLFVYGNYITKLEMRIFNQWGEQIELITNQSRGWDGRYKGKPQPVGVYVYALEAVLRDGRTVKLKGSITLIR